MQFFKGLINTIALLACIAAVMFVIPECEAAGNNKDDYLPVDSAWSRTAVVLTPPRHFGDVVDCVIVDADREIVDRFYGELGYPRAVIFRSPQAVEFGVLGYCMRP